MPSATVTPMNRSIEHTTTILLPARFDVHEVAGFEARITQQASWATVVILDASNVKYLDGAAIASLLKARLRCLDLNGDLAIAAPSAATRIILELAGRYEALNPIETGPIEELKAAA